MTVRLIAITAVAASSTLSANAAPPPCHAPGLTRPAAANSHLLSSDYPVLAVLLREEGDTIVSFVIGTDGKTSALAVSQSSGSLRLDDASLEAVQGWLYTPALSDGAPTACIQQAVVKWRIPEQAEPPKKGQ